MTPQDGRDDPGAPLRYEWINALTTICGRAQLLRRAVWRSPSLGNEEQATLMAGLATIEAAVWTAMAMLDECRPPHSDGRREAELPAP